MVLPHGPLAEAHAAAAEAPPPPPPPWIAADEPLFPRAARRGLLLLSSLARHRALWLAGARRELRARLTGTVLGRLWPLLQPLALFAVYWALFARVFGLRFPTDAGAAAIAPYLFVGVAVWTSFAEGLTRGTVAFVERGELLKRSAFPAEVLPFQAIVAQAALLCFALAAFLVALCVLEPAFAPGPALALVPLLLVMQSLFTLGLALALATLHALLRDTAHVVGVALTLWMFATPIFWVPSASVLPGVEPFLPWLAWNPMHDFLSCWRAALVGGLPEAAFTAPLSVALARAAAWTAGALLFGGIVFALGERRLPDEV